MCRLPLTKNREPDISFILQTGRSIAPHLAKGALVVLESTTYPGTTDEDLRDVLEEGSGMKAGVDFHLAFSPEREDPANRESKVKRIPKVVGGYTPACLEKAMALYGKAIRHTRAGLVLSRRRSDEAAGKHLSQCQYRAGERTEGGLRRDGHRYLGSHRSGEDQTVWVHAVLSWAGLGGHCIPIDPFYLTWKAREYGQHTRFIELAGEINTRMPEHVVHRVAEALEFTTKIDLTAAEY